LPGEVRPSFFPSLQEGPPLKRLEPLPFFFLLSVEFSQLSAGFVPLFSTVSFFSFFLSYEHKRRPSQKAKYSACSRFFFFVSSNTLNQAPASPPQPPLFSFSCHKPNEPPGCRPVFPKVSSCLAFQDSLASPPPPSGSPPPFSPFPVASHRTRSLVGIDPVPLFLPLNPAENALPKFFFFPFSPFLNR